MAKQQELSYDTKLVLTLVLLFLLYPVGVFLVFKWLDWPKWAKYLVAFPLIILAFLFMASVAVVIIGSLRTKDQLDERMIKSENDLNNATYENTCTKQCAASSSEIDACVQKCLQNLKTTK